MLKKKKKTKNADESTHVIPAVKDNTILHSKAQLSLCLFIHISKKHKCNNTKHPESPQQNWSRKGLLILPEAPKINPLLIHPGEEKKGLQLKTRLVTVRALEKAWHLQIHVPS